MLIVKWFQVLLHTLNIQMCGIDIRNLKTRNFTKLVQVRNFLLPLSQRLFDMRRERFNLSMLTFPFAPHHVRHPAAKYWSGLGKPQKSTFFSRGRNSTNCFFSNLSPHFQCVTSPKYPGLNSYLGFLFWHLWMTHPLHTCVNICVNVAPN